MYIIYKIFNRINNYFYIGYTSSTIKIRFINHKKRATYDNNRPLYRKMIEDIDNWDIEELSIHNTKEQATEQEFLLIKQYKDENNEFILNKNYRTNKYIRNRNKLLEYYRNNQNKIKEYQKQYEYNKYHRDN